MGDFVKTAVTEFCANPSHYKHAFTHGSRPIEINVRLSKKAVTLLTDEAFFSDLGGRCVARQRQDFIGCIVAEFIRRHPTDYLESHFKAYMDVLIPIIRRHHGEGR